MLDPLAASRVAAAKRRLDNFRALLPEVSNQPALRALIEQEQALWLTLENQARELDKIARGG